MDKNDVEFMQDVAKFAEVTGKALAVGERIAAKQASDQQAVATVLPSIVARLVEVGLLDKSSADAAMEKLSNHAAALSVLERVADKYQEQKIAAEKTAGDRLGHAVPDSRASRREDNYVGRRAGAGEKRASDEAILKLIGSGAR